MLNLKSLGIENVLAFDFLDHPGEERVENALVNLCLLQALDEDARLTSLGREMASFPLEPNFTNCLLASLELDCSEEMLSLVALLSAENCYTTVSKSDERALRAQE